MVFPLMFVAAGMDLTPSILFSPSLLPGAQLVSFVQSIAGVAASDPVPKMGQTLGLAGLSVLAVAVAVAVAKLLVHVALCQSGLLSLCTPKFEPPTTSR